MAKIIAPISRLTDLFHPNRSGSVKKKLFISIVIQIICFALICGVAFIDAIEHPNLFFYPLMLLAFIINAAGGKKTFLSFFSRIRGIVSNGKILQ